MPGFRAALVFYPACRLKHRFDRGFAPYAPVRVFHGSADEEVSSARCRRLVERSRARGGDIAIEVYPGATHDFDDPGSKRQGVAPMRARKRMQRRGRSGSSPNSSDRVSRRALWQALYVTACADRRPG